MEVKIVVDTNVYSDAFRGIPQAVKIFQQAQVIIITPVVIAELLAGFKGGKNEQRNREQLFNFISQPRVIAATITDQTADRYAFIFHQLKKECTPIPTNDIWIAAITMEQGAKLATRDGHFHKVKGLYLLIP